MKNLFLIIGVIVFVLAAALFLFSGKVKTLTGEKTVSDKTEELEETSKPETKKSPESYGSGSVTLKTNKGDIVFKLYADKAPNAVENFVKLAEAGKYNKTIFHRVINGFMIQGGDYENFNGTGGKSFLGGEFNDEISSDISHVRGAVSMANRGPNTNGSQFFIVQEDSTYLDGNYTIFGQVLEGMEVVDAIASVQTDSMDKPLQDVVLESVALNL